MTDYNQVLRDVLARLSNLESRMTTLEGRMRRVENRVNSLGYHPAPHNPQQPHLQASTANLQARLNASAYNDFARTKNKHIVDLHVAITPLHDCSDNSYIVGFPATYGAIGALPELELDRILAILGQPVNGVRIDKIYRLMHACGWSCT